MMRSLASKQRYSPFNLNNSFRQNQNAGILDICARGLRVRSTNGRELQITPFQSIAVWSAVKFVVSQSEGGAAFLPLITDPENIDKSTLFRPLRWDFFIIISKIIHLLLKLNFRFNFIWCAINHAYHQL